MDLSSAKITLTLQLKITFNDTKDFDRVEKHVFFAGKVYVDSNGVPTFVNLFTIIMD
jgi:hypothetical protein